MKPTRLCAVPLLLLLLSLCAVGESSPRIIHVFVALADNASQGIVPVSPMLGNGEDPARNLYWGSAFGLKTFFSRSPDWKLLLSQKRLKPEVLERCVFKYLNADVYLVADAYRGREIQSAILSFLDAAAGLGAERIKVNDGHREVILDAGRSSLLAYIGHDGLMDFPLPRTPRGNNDATREAIVLACASKQYFAQALRESGAFPLLWTTSLMAPEAYTLKSALDGWIAGETKEQIRDRAATAYAKYQKCGFNAAHKLMATGW